MMKKLDGKKEAEKIQRRASDKLKKTKTKPKLLALSFGTSKYLELKIQAAKKIGAELKTTNNPNQLCSDDSDHGIMIQLPVPKNMNLDNLISQIPPKKDVDGMRDDSSFVAPVVLAVEKAINKACLRDSPSVVVVGGKGFVGRKLVKHFNAESLELGDDFNRLKHADIIISATGKPYTIKANMVKSGVVVIDVGAPLPEFENEVYKKAMFYTPVPGGIGPLTIAYLLDNLVKSARIQTRHTSQAS